MPTAVEQHAILTKALQEATDEVCKAGYGIGPSINNFNDHPVTLQDVRDRVIPAYKAQRRFWVMVALMNRFGTRYVMGSDAFWRHEAKTAALQLALKYSHTLKQAQARLAAFENSNENTTS